jgi:hypothetical protein
MVSNVIRYAIVLVLTLGSLSHPVKAQFDDWNGIRPLVTTRTDVELRLGTAKGNCNCEYETETHYVVIQYSTSDCDEGWNVPKNTVLKYKIMPKTKVTVNDTSVFGEGLVKIPSDTFSTRFVSVERGMSFYVSPYRELEEIQYFPPVSSSSVNSRCTGFSIYNPLGTFYPPFLIFTIKGWKQDIAGFDTISSTYKNSKDHQLYIVINFSKRMTNENKELYLRKLRNRLRQNLGTQFSKTSIITGGSLDSGQIKIFILPKDLPAPKVK